MSLLCFILIMIISGHGHTQEFSMRRCMLLPINDSVDGSMGFYVFEKVENYLKQSEWCVYRPNSEVINILQNYKDQLHVHLQDKNVLKVIAEKVRAGSLIRVELKNQIDGVDVGIDILGHNGEDLYFSEKIRLNKIDNELIAQTIKNWLEEYERTIPYDGQIIGVLGTQFTVDVGKASNIRIGDRVKVKRKTGIRKHPLLKKIVEWDSEVIGEGKIFSVSEFQAVGQVENYTTQKKIQKGDWIRIDRYANAKEEKDPKLMYPEVKDYEFGKLGTVGLSILMSQIKANSLYQYSSSNPTKVNRKLSGLVFGFLLDAEIWGTRNFIGGLDFSKKFGSLDKEFGDIEKSPNEVDMTLIRLYGAYRYLPLGFFYGPRIDARLGYTRYSFGMDNVANDGFGEVSFSGITVGAKASAPIYKDYRLFLQLDIIPFVSYEEDIQLYGEKDSARSFEFNFGCEYAYDPSLNIIGALQYSSNKAEFSGGKEIKFSDTTVRAGVIFSY